MILSPVSLSGETWTQKAIIPGGVRDDAVGFSIGNKGFVGTGYHHGLWYAYQDFWEWDPLTDIWTQKADFTGGLRYGAVGFSIGNKGYIGTGASPTLRKDFWEYDPTLNSWTQKTDFGGTARAFAFGFSIGSKGYIGTGSITGGANGCVADFWEWESDTTSPNYNTWLQKSSFPGTIRYGAVGLAIGTKSYVGTGAAPGDIPLGDFWEWDQPTDTWTQKAAFGGGARFGAAGFALNGLGYIGTGHNGVNKKDLWAWDPATNTWTQRQDLGGFQRSNATGFSIGNRGYIGMGFFFTWSANDFWEYCDTCTAVGVEETMLKQMKVWYDNDHHQLKIESSQTVPSLLMSVYNLTGSLSMQKEININAGLNQTEFKPSGNGVYLVVLAKGKFTVVTKILIN